jgi:pyridoxamine 5'-phosphate oxidase
MSNTDSMEHPSWLTSGDFTEAEDPLALFDAWFAEARKSEPADANAMALATVDADGMPNVRIVLLKGHDARGFAFYTNEQSQKGRELAERPKAALSFHWKSLMRQVRLRGAIARVGAEEADAYFATRPRLSQIGAWASRQSAPRESKMALQEAFARYTAKFAEREVPRPPHWIGLRLVPVVFEFWHDRPFRLHDRVEFRRTGPGAPWVKTALYP